ncbi:uracil phosphoribosyltransferase [bacterium]|jgi:uracil phosphoribosyltransferase|nr:uracil phosphoribosyltransferase [bacterium]MBT5015487.1 uracil phosphoribosyltransferase [bacterium]
MSESTIKQVLLTRLRNKDSSRAQFRAAANKIALVLAEESANFIKTKKVTVETPLETAEGIEYEGKVVLVAILRSGMSMLPVFRDTYPDAAVGFLGIKRNEETAEPEMYYNNIPTIGPDDQVLILDPTIATGGTACAALNLLADLNVKQEQMMFISVISSTQGLEKVRTTFPNVQVTTVGEDTKLNHNKFILPGVGDYGDRYFGTE